jgi:hypothetical protein
VTLALQIQLCLILAVFAACMGGIRLGIWLGHRDRRKAQLRRVKGYRA